MLPTRMGFSCISVCHSSTSASVFALIASWAARNSGDPMPSLHAEATIRSPPGARISIGITMPFTVW